MSRDDEAFDGDRDSVDARRLASGVAHELNNFIGVVAGNLHLIERGLGPEHPADRFVTEIKGAAAEAERFAKELGLLGPQEPHQTNPIDLCALVSRICTGSHITKTVEVGMDHPVMVEDFDFSYFETAVHGWLAFSQACADVSAIRLTARRHEEGDAVLQLEDDGPAYAATPDVFEPFATLADRPKSGLRLALLRDFARRRGGDARVYTPDDGGAGIELRFVAAAQQIGASEGATVLVKLSDPAIRRLVTHALAREGHTVVTGGSEATLTISDDPDAPLEALRILASGAEGEGLAVPFTARQLLAAVRQRLS